MTVYIFGNTFFLFTNTVSLAISFIILSTKTHLDKRPLSVLSKAQAKLIQTSTNNICKIQVKNRTKLQQLKMFMQYNNASNITVLKFKTFPDQFSISSLCIRQDFQSCINLLDHVLSLQSLNHPVNQSLKFQYLCLHWNSAPQTTGTE